MAGIFARTFLAFMICHAVFGYDLIGYIQGESQGDQMGSAFCTLDFNNDGFLDLVISAPAADEAGFHPGKSISIMEGQPQIQ